MAEWLGNHPCQFPWHPWVLRALAGVISEPLSAICQRSWLSGEVPEDWRLAYVTPIIQEGP